MSPLRAIALTHVGNVRDRNEDVCGVDEANGIAFVADGVGGHPAGHIASALVAEVMQTFEDVLDASVVLQIQQKMRAHLAEHPEHSGLSTTLDAIQLEPDGTLHLVHIGDSRIYQFTGGVLEPLTEDHSYVGDLVRAGMLTREQARLHPMSNLITRYIGADTPYVPDVRTLRVEPGTRLLLATDGLTDMVAESELAELMAAIDDRDALAHALVQAALAAGGRDNISLVLAEVPGPSRA